MYWRYAFWVSSHAGFNTKPRIKISIFFIYGKDHWSDNFWKSIMEYYGYLKNILIIHYTILGWYLLTWTWRSVWCKARSQNGPKIPWFCQFLSSGFSLLLTLSTQLLIFKADDRSLWNKRENKVQTTCHVSQVSFVWWCSESPLCSFHCDTSNIAFQFFCYAKAFYDYYTHNLRNKEQMSFFLLLYVAWLMLRRK